MEEKKFCLSQEEAHVESEAEIAKSAAKGQAFSYMPSLSSDILQHKPRSETDLKTVKVEALSVVRNLSFSENHKNPVDIASVRHPRHSSQHGQSDLVLNNMPDNFHQEAIELQCQQTALQAQQNWIVELLAVNQKKGKLPHPCVPTFHGDPVEYCTFIRAFESHHLHFDDGYQEALRLLKKKYGDEYHNVCAYKSKALANCQSQSQPWQTAKTKVSIFCHPSAEG